MEADELRRQNAELSARVDELTAAFAQKEALAQLAAGTVHDLRNVFNVALIAAETLLQTLSTGEERELAQAVLTAAEHGTFLAQDLLNVARRTPLRPTSCSELLPRLRRMIERIALKRFSCVFEVSPHVNAVSGDQAQLEAAIVNLAVNARDAMPNGGTLSVSVLGVPEDLPVPPGLPRGRYVQFALRDTGAGMSREVLAHATEAFFTTKGASGGTGLGLAMAHAFAQRSGGALHIESQLGRGTCIRLTLPSETSAVALRAVAPNSQLDKIMARVRHPGLRQALETWRELCPADGLPRPVAIEARLVEHADNSLCLSIVPGKEPHALQLLRVGSRLLPQLERTPLPELAVDGPVLVGTLEAAYRRALSSRAPSYEYASYTLADGVLGTIERLILPAATDGKTVSHLIGIIHFTGALVQGRER